jgi:starch synthase
MNILQIGTGAIKMPPLGYGGVELVIYSTSKHMVRAGHEVTIFDIKESEVDPDAEYTDGIKFVRLHTRKKGTPFRNFVMSYISTRIDALVFALKVNKYIRRNNFDTIHLHATLIGLILTFLNRRLRRRMVFTVHSPGWDMPYSSRWDRFALAMDYRLMTKVGRVIVFTDALKEKLVAMGKVKPEKVAVIHLGVDPGKFRPDIDASGIKRKYELEGRTTILFVGRIAPYKGAEYLVKAADIVVNHFGCKEAMFLLLGARTALDNVQHSDYISRIIRFIKDHGLEANLTLVGTVPSDELPPIFSACDIFVLPSLGETFGLVVSQAMASGKPIIGTKLAGILVQVRDGWNGYVVDPANEHQLAEKIKYLIDQPGERRRMGLNGRKFAEDEFDWSKVSDRILQVYQTVV